MKLLCWQSFGWPMHNILPNSLSWTENVTTLSMLNESQKLVDVSIGCCSIDWLMQLQQSSCPLVRLLILGLLALPVYNAILIVMASTPQCFQQCRAFGAGYPKDQVCQASSSFTATTSKTTTASSQE
ncbi:uncharacterized protein LOC120448019 isoform X2 [Drosophila santomea]|uniref:uncharacterized protein LOC120448019 isoform X2 n=1 Tax=Drosophila santomea TaxID=129105 RepID=UPI0019537542|nr:uncharacterized protein LOC120448019 isoform X2 [Drosophila santomea]